MPVQKCQVSVTNQYLRAPLRGSLVTPFDLGQWSQLINLAGTNPSATDLRCHAVIGAEREWGALEYDPNIGI